MTCVHNLGEGVGGRREKDKSERRNGRDRGRERDKSEMRSGRDRGRERDESERKSGRDRGEDKSERRIEGGRGMRVNSTTKKTISCSLASKKAVYC